MALRSNSLPTLLEAHQVVERVVERAQVRIDLLRQVAGQEAEALAGLDGRAGQHDALTSSRSKASTAQATAR
jgi:hypothetical protein